MGEEIDDVPTKKDASAKQKMLVLQSSVFGPSRSDVVSTCDREGIPECRHQEAFCSKKADAPAEEGKKKKVIGKKKVAVKKKVVAKKKVAVKKKKVVAKKKS